jgi:glyceraldehyde-3-phosphate dehydrogenase/erythrose-4-phosphate dehydrogenase
MCARVPQVLYTPERREAVHVSMHDSQVLSGPHVKSTCRAAARELVLASTHAALISL